MMTTTTFEVDVRDADGDTFERVCTAWGDEFGDSFDAEGSIRGSVSRIVARLYDPIPADLLGERMTRFLRATAAAQVQVVRVALLAHDDDEAPEVDGA